MPSPTSRTVPTSSTWRSTSKDAICWRMMELISSVLICGMASYPLTLNGGEAPPHVLEAPAHRPVEDAVADVDPEATDDLRIDGFSEDDFLLRALLQGGLQRGEELGVELAGRDHPGLDPSLVLVDVLVELLHDVVEEGLAPLFDEDVQESQHRPADLALEGQVEDPALLVPPELRQVEERHQVGVEPVQRVEHSVQIVVDLPDGTLGEAEVEERLGIDASGRLRDVHSLVATSSTTSRARRRWSSSRSSRPRSRADASRVSSTVTCFSSSIALARSRPISFLARSRSAPISSCAARMRSFFTFSAAARASAISFCPSWRASPSSCSCFSASSRARASASSALRNPSAMRISRSSSFFARPGQATLLRITKVTMNATQTHTAVTGLRSVKVGSSPPASVASRSNQFGMAYAGPPAVPWTSRQTTTAKRQTPSMKAAVMIVTPRMSLAASGWRAIDSVALDAIRPIPIPAPMAATPAPMPAPMRPAPQFCSAWAASAARIMGRARRSLMGFSVFLSSVPRPQPGW